MGQWTNKKRLLYRLLYKGSRRQKLISLNIACMIMVHDKHIKSEYIKKKNIEHVKKTDVDEHRNYSSSNEDVNEE